MKYCWSTVLVKDMEASVSFYRDVLGLNVAARFKAMPGLEIAFLETGETQIELVCNAEAVSAAVGDAVSFGFVVDSMEEALRMVREKNIPIHSGPFIHPNVKYFFVQDPDGLKIQLKELLET